MTGVKKGIHNRLLRKDLWIILSKNNKSKLKIFAHSFGNNQILKISNNELDFLYNLQKY